MNSLNSERAFVLFKKLNQQIERLAERLNTINPLLSESTQLYFTPGLFRSHSHDLRDYLAEIQLAETQLNCSYFNALATKQQVESFAFIANKLLMQIAALQREIATTLLRQYEHAHKPTVSADPYQKLAQYYEFRRRLKAMQQEAEKQLLAALSPQEKDQYQLSLATLTGRYRRCCQAIDELEQQLTHSEKNQHF